MTTNPLSPFVVPADTNTKDPDSLLPKAKSEALVGAPDTFTI
jgi:hypothetical protein